MTSSPTRPIFPRTASRPARRAKLLAASALIGSFVGGMATMQAQPALAGTLPGIPGAGSITVSSGGSQPLITFPDAITLQIDLNAPRTVINWSSLHLSSGDAMNFLFDSASDIVLNKTTSQIQFDNGSVVTGKVGAATGGNVWFYSPQGVIVSPGATMTAGGFLFSRGSGISDVGFVDAAAPLAFLRSATDALIRITTISSATSASINSSGDVVLSASSGPLNVAIAAGATVDVSTTSGSITASEVTATSGAATVAAGGPGATVTSITGATGVSVSSGANSSVGSATTTASGDILIQSNGSASLTLGNSARDLTLSAPLAFVSTVDAARDVFITGTTGTTVTNRIFAGDDIEITATNGDVSAGGAYLKSTGLGASDDAHILLRSDTGSVAANNTLLTQGTGAQAGDITIQAATTASVGAADSTRDLKITGTSASLTSGTAARDLFVTATVGDASVTTKAFAGRSVEITSALGDVLAGAATLKSTGLAAGAGSHVLARSSSGSVTVGAATTEGTGVAAGDVVLDAFGAITATSAQSTRDVVVTAGDDIDLASATAERDITITSFAGQAILRKAVLTGSGAGHDLSITADDDAVLGDPDYSAITAANVFSRTGGNTGTASVKSSGSGDALVHLDTSSAIDTLEGAGVDVTINSGAATFGVITALADNVYVEALDGGLTVGTATANNGNLDLYAYGGDLTLTGSAHGAGLVHLQADGLVDASAASLVSSDGDLELIGGAVSAGHITADGAIDVGAATGNAVVQKAEAGQTVQVVSLGGDAALRGGEGPDGIAVIALNKATFGADDKASITAANYAITDASCGCGSGGLQVMSYDGDAVVNINSASNGVALAAAGIDGDVTVVQKTGDLKIDEIAGYNITLEAMAGTLETGDTTSSGGDYSITAHDFLGDALTPFLFTGQNHDVTITDTLGDLDLGAAVIHAGRKLTITAQDGAVTGLAQLDAGTGLGDGEVKVTATAIALDTVASDGDVALDGGTGLVDVATSVSVDNDYHLTGGSFSDVALAPLGAKAGSWYILDQADDFDFTGKTLHYGGAIGVAVTAGDVIGGDITSDTGAVYVEANSGRLGALKAGGGNVTAIAYIGGMAVDSAKGVQQIQVSAASGTASLGAAVLTGAGANNLLVHASNGDVVLGGGTSGAITSANIITSAGASTVVEASTLTGTVDVNLDHTTTADLTTIEALGAVRVAVVNGSQRIIYAGSINGAVRIDGPTGALTVDQLSAHATSQVNGGGDTRLASANVTGGLTLTSVTGNLRFGDAVPGRVIDVSGALSLDAHTDIAQQGALRANSLGVTAGTGAVLLGANEVAHLGAVNVTAGGFAFHDTVAFDITAPITAAGQTVDLRSDQTIGQLSTAVITAQTLTGSSVGGASFGAANHVAQLGDFTNTGGLLRFNDARSLTFTGTVLSTGTVSIASHGGMTFASTGTVQANGAGDAVVLASDGVFTNGRGADAVTVANAAGRWLIYTQAVGAPLGSTAGNALGGLAGKSFYGSAYNFSTGAFGTAPNAGNRFVYAYQPTLIVTPDSRIVTYGGVVPTTSATITGLVGGDLAADAWSGAAAISGATSKNVGTYTLTAGAGSLVSDLNYAFAYGTGTLRIDPKALTGVLDADDKTYDRTTTATGAVLLSGLILGDDVSAAGTYAFGDWNAGGGKAVTATGVALSGGDSANYTLASVGAGSAGILKRSLTGALTAGDKTYDGATTATGTIGLTGVLAGDTVSASGTYAFADQNAGTGKTVTVSDAVLGGLDAVNYDLGGVSGDLADILRRAVTVSADSGFKPFGHVDPPLTYRVTVGGLVAGDAFTGGLTRGAGETPGGYGITRGTLDLSTNYDLTFTGATFTINPLPSNEQDGSAVLKRVNQSPDFTLDWDPEPNLATQGAACPGEGCPPPVAASGGGKVAALR